MHSGKLPFNALFELIGSYIFTLLVGLIIDDEGRKSSPHFFALANCVLTLSHEIADPERGLSINNYPLKIHGLTTSESTIEALRLVKDFNIRKDGIEKVSISKTFKNGQNSHALYIAKLAEENRQKREAAENIKRIEEDNQNATEIKEIDNGILMIKNGIKMAEKSIEEGNLELEKQLKQSNLNRDVLASAHSKISMSVKRKNELENGLKSAKIKRKKLN